jgi:aminopeptidase-like protein
VVAGPDPAALGKSLYELVAQLYPIHRSITGDGVRKTLELIAARIDLTVTEVPSGTQVFDWMVPLEWNLADAYIVGPTGQRVAEIRDSNLHVVAYSTPIHERMSLADLRPHLHSLPDHPEWVPYRTSYYTPTWGFCISQAALGGLEEGEYEVVIDASLTEGHLTYGEILLPGASTDEVLVHTHVCHPSLANDNCSGIAVAVALAELISRRDQRYSYRFLFVPGTIGAITWLSLNPEARSRVTHGLVVSNVGDSGPLTYKRSQQGDAEIDRIASHVIQARDPASKVVEFSPYGYDERQYCSPGIDLPVGSFSRSSFGQFPEYHTSADDLTLVQPEHLGDSIAALLEIVDAIEGNATYRNLNPMCEPQLGRRGLYRLIGGESGLPTDELAVLWVLNQSDGEHSLLDIAERSGLSFSSIRRAADALLSADLLEKIIG